MKAILLVSAFLAVCATATAEVLICEFWSPGNPPPDFTSVQFAEMRSKSLKAVVRIEKPTLAIGDLRGLSWKAGEKSKMKKEDYRGMFLVTVFRKEVSGKMVRIVDGVDSSSVPLRSVYDTDVIIFYEPVIR